MPAENTIIKYVKDSKGKLKGVVLATKDSDTHFSLGWSLCDSKDTFNKKHGVFIAKQRALSSKSISLPESLIPHLEEIKERGLKYFKGCECLDTYVVKPYYGKN